MLEYMYPKSKVMASLKWFHPAQRAIFVINYIAMFLYALFHM